MWRRLLLPQQYNNRNNDKQCSVIVFLLAEVSHDEAKMRERRETLECYCKFFVTNEETFYEQLLQWRKLFLIKEKKMFRKEE